MPTFVTPEEIYDSLEFSFMIKVKTVNSKNTDLYMQLMLENGQPFSLTACYEPKIMD